MGCRICSTRSMLSPDHNPSRIRWMPTKRWTTVDEDTLDLHRMTQRHPVLRSLFSRSRPYCALVPLESSSSIISCGLTVICTTLGASQLNFESEDHQYIVPRKAVSFIPDRGDLSSSNFPNEINRIELGEAGRGSQSTYHVSDRDIQPSVRCASSVRSTRFSDKIGTYQIAIPSRSAPSGCKHSSRKDRGYRH